MSVVGHAVVMVVLPGGWGAPPSPPPRSLWFRTLCRSSGVPVAVVKTDCSPEASPKASCFLRCSRSVWSRTRRSGTVRRPARVWAVSGSPSHRAGTGRVVSAARRRCPASEAFWRRRHRRCLSTPAEYPLDGGRGSADEDHPAVQTRGRPRSSPRRLPSRRARANRPPGIPVVGRSAKTPVPSRGCPAVGTHRPSADS
jgi:hypothetical protein